MPLLSLENLAIAYPPTPQQRAQNSLPWAVDDVSFSLEAGEKLGLVGESGSGKSTIGRGIMGLLPPESKIAGQLCYQDKNLQSLTPKEKRLFRGEVVGLVFQDPMTRLDPLMTIGDHCLETLRSHQKLSKAAAKQKALETLAAVKIPPERWGQYPHEFSGGMRQRVAIALALLLEPKLIIADEPTTSLDVTVASEILQELSRLCEERHLGLILISHDLAMVGTYCDRIAVMNQGKIVEMGPVSRIFQAPQHPYTQQLLDAALHLHRDNGSDHPEVAPPPSAPQALLTVAQIQQHYTLESNLLQQWLTRRPKAVIKAVDGVSFSLEPGEIFGLVGESGCGKSTLSRTILRLVEPTGGTVTFQGQDLGQLTPAQMRSQRRHLQMIFQDPHACLNPRMTVGQAIADPLFIHQLATPETAKTKVLAMLEKVGLTPVADYYSRYPADLSGGQQQRVAIARALITEPKLIIADEPVSMLDASVQAQVLALMLALKEEFQLTYLFITHDLAVARFFCDRIAVMNQGKIVEVGATESIFTNPQHSYTKKLLDSAPLLTQYTG